MRRGLGQVIKPLSVETNSAPVGYERRWRRGILWMIVIAAAAIVAAMFLHH